MHPAPLALWRRVVAARCRDVRKCGTDRGDRFNRPSQRGLSDVAVALRHAGGRGRTPARPALSPIRTDWRRLSPSTDLCNPILRPKLHVLANVPMLRQTPARLFVQDSRPRCLVAGRMKTCPLLDQCVPLSGFMRNAPGRSIPSPGSGQPGS